MVENWKYYVFSHVPIPWFAWRHTPIGFEVNLHSGTYGNVSFPSSAIWPYVSIGIKSNVFITLNQQANSFKIESNKYQEEKNYVA